MKTILSCTAALAIAGLLPLTAQAEQVQPVYVQAAKLELRSEVVPYADLNLSADAGLRTLKTRIAGAARRVCDTSGAGLQRRGIDACRKAATEGALSRMSEIVMAGAGEGSTALVVLANR